MSLSCISLSFSFFSNSPLHSTFPIRKTTGVECVKQATPPFLQKMSELQPSVRTELEEEKSLGMGSFHLEDYEDWSPWSSWLDLESHRNSPLCRSMRVSRKASVKKENPTLNVKASSHGLWWSLHTEEKVSWAQASISLLSEYTMSSTISCSCGHAFSIMMDYIFSNCHPRWIFPFSICLLLHIFTAARKVTHTMTFDIFIF